MKNKEKRLGVCEIFCLFLSVFLCGCSLAVPEAGEEGGGDRMIGSLITREFLDLLPEELRRRGLFPVGRLDKDTTGLLLLTDDGGLAHRLLSPKKHVDKVYLAEVEGRVDQDDVRALEAGMVLGDGLHCLPAGLEPLGNGSVCLVTLREGKYHQVKRMLAARGKPVTALHRLSMGPLALDEGLKPGNWRFLTPQERAELWGLEQTI